MQSSTISSSRADLGGKYLSVLLDQEAYAISVLKVREIIRMTKIVPVAQMPTYVRGVINLRGRVIPVTDLRLKFGLTAANADRECIVVTQLTTASKREILMGFIVDSVEDVSAIAHAEIENTPHLGGGVDTQYLLGMAKVKGGVKMILDVDRVIAADALEAAARAA